MKRTSNMKRTILAFWLLLLATGAAAQLYHPGEELHYRVSYKAKLFPNTEVASVEVATSEETLDGETVCKVVGRGRTLPTYRWFFGLDDLYTIYVDPVSLRTVRFESDIHEGDYTFRSSYVYDWERMQVATEWSKRTDPAKSKEMELSERSMDAISLFFNMRSSDADSFAPGEQRTLQMVLEDTVRCLSYRFIGREVKKIRSQGKFRTLKFACQLGTSEGYSFTDGTEFSIWISDDENKIPLYLESPIRVGSICAYISEYKGLKYPLTSKMK